MRSLIIDWVIILVMLVVIASVVSGRVGLRLP